MITLALVAFFVGALIGAVGIGGILLIPAIEALAGIGTREAMGTALFSFIFTAVIGTWLFARRGSVDWRVALPVCLGATLCGYLGALLNAVLGSNWLNLSLSLVIIFAGASVLRPLDSGWFARSLGPGGRWALLAAIGASVGFVAGLTGVGGPVLSIPIMVVLGFSPLVAIATGQVIQVAAATSGSIGYLAQGTIDFSLASWLTLVQLVGLVLGVRWGHSRDTGQLKRMVAVVCLGVGAFLLARTVGRLGHLW